MNLRERLESMRSAPARPLPLRSSAPLPYLIPLQNAKGITYYNDKIYIDYHGSIDLKNFPNFSADIIGFLSLSRPDDFDVREALFLDIETTGTAGGAGTLAFLVGMGFLEQGYFQVRQYFLHDVSEESAFLQEIEEFSRRFRYLVTYNGKCFDAQVLRTRYLMHRRQDPLVGKHHIDMLFIARRLWKRRFQECNLTNLERALLDFERQDDIPGYLIPSAYTDYLRFANGSLIEKVLHHNQWDIVSLAVLMARACLLSHQINELSPEEHYSLSVLYERHKDYRKAVEHQILALRSQFGWTQGCLLSLAQNLRRLKDFDGMKALLDQVQKENLTDDLARKLCIICEHDLHDYELGLSLVYRQIAKLERYRGIGSRPAQLLSEWQTRKARLERKNHTGAEGRLRS